MYKSQNSSDYRFNICAFLYLNFISTKILFGFFFLKHSVIPESTSSGYIISFSDLGKFLNFSATALCNSIVVTKIKDRKHYSAWNRVC